LRFDSQLRVVPAYSGVSPGVDVIDSVVEMRALRTNRIWSTDRIENTLLAETFVLLRGENS
jgi:hypothetical protein